MTQITHGVRGILTFSAIYDLMQNVAGAKRGRETFCRDYLRVKSGDVVLDIGCGTAAILDSLPVDIRYFGFDLSSEYIAAAKERYGIRGDFHCRNINAVAADELPPCDIAITSGLLHHLDDDEAKSLIANIHRRLNTGGRLITIDGCFHPGQSLAARMILKADRGQNVRTIDGYADLARSSFAQVSVNIRHDMNRIPYTHAILECTK